MNSSENLKWTSCKLYRPYQVRVWSDLFISVDSLLKQKIYILSRCLIHKSITSFIGKWRGNCMSRNGALYLVRRVIGHSKSRSALFLRAIWFTLRKSFLQSLSSYTVWPADINLVRLARKTIEVLGIFSAEWKKFVNLPTNDAGMLCCEFIMQCEWV
jgi:hypothetical protein